MKKKKRVLKITTIEGLAAAMAEGFADVHMRFDKVDERLKRIETRSESFEALLRQLDHRLTAVESKLFGIQRRLDDEAMERVDVKALFTRLERVEAELFGKK